MHSTARVLALLLPLGACSTSIHLDSAWSTWSSMSAAPTTDMKVVAIDCSGAATSVATKLRANAAAGELTLVLVDPNGEERHRQVVASGECTVTQTWPANEGRWTLTVDAKEFTGSYSVALEANDAPIQVNVEIAGDVSR